MSDYAADRSVAVENNPTHAWNLASLPDHIRDQLVRISSHRGYGSMEELMASGGKVWKPACSMNKIAPEVLSRAQKLRDVLKKIVSGWDDKAEHPEFIRTGLQAYKKFFDHEVTPTHLRRLITRTIGRDGGRANWDRLELYLPDKVARRKEVKADVTGDGKWGVATTFAHHFKDPSNPSATEARVFWDALFDQAEGRIANGEKEKPVMREMRSYLKETIAFVKCDGRALEALVRRRLERWRCNGRNAHAIGDRRAGNSGRKGPLLLIRYERFLRKLCARILQNEGQIARAWREARKEGWMPKAISTAYSHDWAKKKSYVPRAIHEAVGATLRAVRARHKGAYINRDYSRQPSGRVFQGDDFTFNHYFWIPDAQGNPMRDENGRPILTRGQSLVWVCARSHYIVTGTLVPAKSYTAIDILRSVKRLHEVYGLPEILYIENGRWAARLIDGTREEDCVPWAEMILGLAPQGIHVRHTQPGNPRSKIIENIGGQLQNAMTRLRGYVGRGRGDCPPETTHHLNLVKAGAHPALYFYSMAELKVQLERVMNEFNREPQNGKMLNGLSPMQAFEKFRQAPPIKLPTELSYLEPVPS